MKTYKITYTATLEGVINIKANTESSAIVKFYDDCTTTGGDIIDSAYELSYKDIKSIEEVTEEDD